MSHQLDNINVEDDVDMEQPDLPIPGAAEDIDFPEWKVGEEKNVTADGGVTKKVLVAGQGYETPETGDEVTVHYVGTLLDGTEFDSSRGRNEPFVFELGKGKVIKGWDLGVATMTKGEKAILTCKPDYAYGSRATGSIPANSTLKFEVELLSWKSDKDLTSDGGVVKTILEEGEGYDTPKPKDEVLVTYTARVKGSATPFVVSPEGGVEFELRDGHLVEAISVAVKTMKEKERVNLKVLPKYGFGEKGDEAKGVPPNAELDIDLHLLSWKAVEDVTDDGEVLKKTLAKAPNADWKRPNDGASCTIQYVAKLPDGTVVDEHGEDNPVKFITDEGQIIPGLEQAVQKMKRGEKALVSMTAKYAYGAEGFTGSAGTVPPNSDINFEVTLVDFDNAKEEWEMNDEEKIEAAKARKEKGNTAYGKGDLDRAVKMYDKAVAIVNYDKNFAESVKSSAKEIKKSCWSNLAMVCLKKKDYKGAISNCDKVLELDSLHVKALHRRAQAYLANEDFIEAERDLKAALDVEPNNTAIVRTMRELKVKMKEANKKEAALYGKMFKALGKLSANDPAPTQTPAADTSGMMELLSSGEETKPVEAAPPVQAAA